MWKPGGSASSGAVCVVVMALAVVEVDGFLLGGDLVGADALLLEGDVVADLPMDIVRGLEDGSLAGCVLESCGLRGLVYGCYLGVFSREGCLRVCFWLLDDA